MKRASASTGGRRRSIGDTVSPVRWLRWARRASAAVRQHERVGEAGRDLLEVMGHQHDGGGRGRGPSREVGEELLAAADVEAGGGLVEQDEPGIAHQRAGEQHALAFAGRQGREAGASASAAQPKRSSSVERACAVGVGVLVPPRRQRGVARGHHDLGGGHAGLEARRERG